MNDTTGFAAFALYNAIKLHFTSDSYDFFRYNGKTNVSRETFAKRKDKYSFYKLSRKYSIEELRDFYLANIIENDFQWVGEISGAEGEESHKKWKKRIESLTYSFENDIVELLEKETLDREEVAQCARYQPCQHHQSEDEVLCAKW